MESDDGLSTIGTASTDTSMFIRELQALNTEGNNTGLNQERQSLLSDTVTASGDDGESRTLTQAMKTLIGNRPPQIIDLAENIDESGASVYSPDVDIYVAPSTAASSASNKVKVTPIVNFSWESKYYHGNLVAVHRDLVFVAFVIKGKESGNVRVISRKSADRVLLKFFSGTVMDISFALSDDVYLAAADEGGNLFVYSLTEEGDKISHTLILHVEKEIYGIESKYRLLTRVIWCPYMPEDEADTDSIDPAKMLVFLHGTEAEVWNVDLVARQYGPGPLSSKKVASGVMCVEPFEKMMPVVNAAFAPDGSAIAVAYLSGIVKFFLVDLEGESSETECMYDWNPHDGQPVTSLYFLDDHKHPVSDLQLWKFALTGARHNTEIKLWSCETWACVQTITFHSPLGDPDQVLHLKSEIDLTSKYLALSDINAQKLYILQIYQNYSNSTSHVSSISQFTLAQSCLSFAIFEAGMKKFKHSANDSHLDEITTGELDENDGDEDVQEGRNVADMEGKVTTGVQIKMYGIHTKTLQELLIRYRPETSVQHLYTQSISSISQEEIGLRDMLSDLSIDQSEVSNDVSSNQINSQPVLMTPQAFAVSSPSAVKGNPQMDVSQVSMSSTSSFTNVTAMNDDILGLHSPRSSFDPSSIMTPNSILIQTPTSKPSPGHVSLSDVPLPPVTSVEEDELATPRNPRIPGSANQSLNASTRSNQDILDELFSGTQALASSKEPEFSTGQFPVSCLMSNHGKEEDGYDENDKEVAEALGLQEDVEEEIETIGLEEHEEKKEVLWPEPPDVSTEAKRLVSAAIEQSTQEEDEKDFFDDENDEAEVEEIIQRHVDEETDENNTALEVGYNKRSHRRNHFETPVNVLTSIDSSIANLASQLRQQQKLMQDMQSELNRQREIQLQLHRHQMEQQQIQQMAAQQPSLEKDISKLEDILVTRMEHSLAQHMQRETQRLQDSLKQSDVVRKQRDDALQTAVIEQMSRSVKDNVASVLRSEIKQTVNPALHRFIEPMKEKIHQEVAHRLTACDSLLKDNIAKAVKSKSTMDVLATSVGDAIYQQMQQAYTDTFKVSMLPAFKATMEKTVRDVHGIFQQGTKEYQLYMRQNVDQMLKERVAAQDIVSRMEGAEQRFVQSIDQMKNLVVTSVRNELGGQVNDALSGFKDDILKEVKKIVKEEVGSSLREHGATISNQLSSYLRSTAATPVPLTVEEESSKDKIMRELRAGRVNEAFQCALSASNLELVVYTCEVAKPLEIFSQKKCPLTQPVLLSLISQLSANLEKNFDLKLKYLKGAVLSLDADQPTTSEHIPHVLAGLVQRLQTTDAHGGDAKKIKAVKFLIMAAKSLTT
ncbi:enhancer of mRNA-decapping protein 4-like [Physella acuta]|uniref:enhancer of mRNA-decapping protein 4-like n=1 Tax=Physella acuta TaxID=109671 RepID=UPI0027DDBB60|nr:enhancer of mRNA-decapping protein 4-like [Physella acuta]